MELPTYTNIWKIEKRLYKLYDFRLPMPLPVGQVAAFVAIAVPYMLILTMAGMPFSHTWVWLYVLPPGVLAWLVTRPVLEGKRLPELVLSQLRYLSEPRTWCRMAPLAEKDEITVVARVWRRTPAATPSVPISPAAGATKAAPTVNTAEAAGAEDPTEFPGRPLWPGSPAIHASAAPSAVTGPAAAAAARPATMPAVTEPAEAGEVPVLTAKVPVRATAAASTVETSERLIAEPRAKERPATERPAPDGLATEQPAPDRSATERPATEQPAPGQPAPGQPAPEPPAPKAPWQPGARPGLTVRTDGGTAQSLHLVERALRSSPGGDPASGWRDRVVVVPGGHRPGKPDQVQRDQARARLPVAGPARVVVLGCTAGAGQTVTTLLTGHVLAALRSEAVAVLDLAAGPGSLTEQARQIPRLLPGRRNAAWLPPGSQDPGPRRERGLQVVTASDDADEPADAGTLIDAVVARYPLTLADPAAAQVPRALNVADQLVLVAPASPDAAGAVAMTLEWLDGHGHADLARRAVAVLNGVSANSAAHTDKAAAVATGQCRAIVRVPWDAALSGEGALGVATIQAYTALAGVLVSGLADITVSSAGQSGSAHWRRDSQ